MGFLDSISGAVLGKVFGDQPSGMAQVAAEMFTKNGGLGGILEKFKSGGMAEQAASWVGEGENLPVSAEQISNILGDGAIADMAAKFGLTPETLSAQIAQYLPSMVDKLTPDGEVTEQSGGLLSSLLGMLK